MELVWKNSEQLLAGHCLMQKASSSMQHRVLIIANIQDTFN